MGPCRAGRASSAFPIGIYPDLCPKALAISKRRGTLGTEACFQAFWVGGALASAVVQACPFKICWEFGLKHGDMVAAGL